MLQRLNIITNQKRKKKRENLKTQKSTAPGIPRRSPIQVLTGPDAAWLRWSDENRYIQRGMVVGESNCFLQLFIIDVSKYYVRAVFIFFPARVTKHGQTKASRNKTRAKTRNSFQRNSLYRPCLQICLLNAALCNTSVPTCYVTAVRAKHTHCRNCKHTRDNMPTRM